MRSIARLFVLLAALALSSALSGCESGETAPWRAPAGGPLPATAPSLSQRHLLLISIDGLRPDIALRADMPHLRRMLEQGSFTFWARTTDVALTLPSHTTLVTGVSPRVHGVTWNRDRARPAGEKGFTAVPTLFQLARQAGLTTALVAGKSKFVALALPGSLDWPVIPEVGDDPSDADIADRAVRMIQEHRPRVMLVHLPDLDQTGHTEQWGSPRHVAAAGAADRALGRVLAALAAAGLRERTLVILTADHGGTGGFHGGTKMVTTLDAEGQVQSVKVPDYASWFIPWIAVGPGVRPNLDLTRDRNLEVRLEDSFATACDWLGIVPPPHTEGKVVSAIYGRPTAPATQPAAGGPADTVPAY